MIMKNRRKFGRTLPIEVSYDELTEDIEENRLIKAANYMLKRVIPIWNN
jgi:5-methylcytosine-specific restriction endonuclease McrBC regulatory subunit McrC